MGNRADDTISRIGIIALPVRRVDKGPKTPPQVAPTMGADWDNSELSVWRFEARGQVT